MSHWDHIVTYSAYAAMLFGLAAALVFFTVGTPVGTQIVTGLFIAFIGLTVFYLGTRLYNELRGFHSQTLFWRTHFVSDSTHRIVCKGHHCEFNGRFPEDKDVQDRLTTWGYE